MKQKTQPAVSAVAPFGPDDAMTVLAALVQPLMVLGPITGSGERTVIFANDTAQALGLPPKAFAPGTIIGAALAKVEEKRSPVILYDVDVAGNHQAVVSVTAAGDDLVVAMTPPPQMAEQGRQARDALRPAAFIARTLAHEIKNPLAGICAAAQLLSRQDLGADAAELSDLIHREGQRITRLVDSMSFLDEESTSVLLPLNLHAPVEQALRSLSVGSNVDFLRDFDPSLPDISGDHDKLVQVVINLCRNAIEADARHIWVRTYYDLSRSTVDRASHRQLPVVLSIEDDGRGMTEETRQRLFDAYFTTKPDGQGLGLAIVAKIMQDAGGQIAVDSRAGKTVFSLYFPLSSPTEVPVS